MGIGMSVDKLFLLRLELDSKEGKGTTVALLLPADG